MKNTILLLSLNLLLNTCFLMAQSEFQNKVPLYSPFVLETSYTATKRSSSEIAALKPQNGLINKILEEKPPEMKVILPINQDSTLILLLRRSENLMPGLKQVTGTDYGDKDQKMDFVSYQGTVNGIKDSWVSLSISNIGFRATLIKNGQSIMLSPLPVNEKNFSDLHVLRKRSSEINPYLNFKNDIITSPIPDISKLESDNSITDNIKSKGNQNLFAQDTLKVKVSVESDYETFIAFNKNKEQATFYLLSLFAAVSQVYERELKIKLMLSYIRIWETPDDPYSSNITSSGQLDGEFMIYWLNNMQYVDRNIAHFHTKRITGITNPGLSGPGLLCSKNSYSFSQNPDIEVTPTAIYIVAHEIGHNFNSPHTHACVWPVGPGSTLAPIDLCGPNCTGVTEYINNGTIMSYCAQTPLVFHPLEKIIIKNVVRSSTCIGDGNAESFMVSGKVTIGDKGLAGVNITANIVGPVIAQTTTNSDGKYTLNLPVNGYNIKAKLDYYSILGRDGINSAYAAVVADVNELNFTAIAVNEDKYEFDNIIDQAKLIAVDGTIQQHTIHNEYDSDCIKFFARAGDTITISSYPGENGWDYTLDLLSLNLYDTDGTTQLAFSFVHPRITYIVKQTGTYFIAVLGPIGPYGISVSASNVATFIPDQTPLQIKVYPNPVTDYIMIELPFEGPYTIEVSQLDGRLSYYTQMVGCSYRLDLSSLQKGIYTLTIKSKEFKHTEKIIKL
jgi:hypothetical protein